MSDPRDSLRVLSARRWTIVAVTIIAVAIGISYTVLKAKTYSSSASIQFQEQTDIGVLDPGVSTPVDVNPSESASAESQIVTRADVLAAVKRTTGTILSTGQLLSAVNVSVEPTSNLIVIGVSSKHAQDAKTLANAFARQTQVAAQNDTRQGYAQEVSALQTKLATGSLSKATKTAYRQAISRLSVLSQVAMPVQIVRYATVSGTPTSPKPAEDIALALILGLIAGIATAYTREAFDQRLSTAEVEQALGLQVVGYVREETLGQSMLSADAGSAPPDVDHLETFRILKTNVAFLARDEEITSVAVTSAVAEEGKSTVSAWYAYASAAAGVRTMLVDCDLRKPRLAERLKLEPRRGLTDYLLGQAEAEEIVHSVSVTGPDALPLSVITAGAPFDLTAELIESRKFRSFVEEVSSVYDLLIFDTAPLLLVSDTFQLIPQVDLVLMCVRVGQTTRHQAAAAKRALENLPGRPTGAVVTGIRRKDDSYAYYYDRYGYGQNGATPSDGRRRLSRKG